MPNTSPSVALYNIKSAADTLDAQVTDAMGVRFKFPHDPRKWSSGLEEYLSARYRMKAEACQKAIRAVSQKFVGTDRTDDLLRRSSGLFDRTGIINGMVDASPWFILLEMESQAVGRLRDYLPVFRDTMRVVLGKMSRWHQDFREWQGIFLLLESAAITDALLHSVPATVPDALVTQGQDLINRLVGFWSERKDVVEAANHMYDRGILEDPEPLLERLNVQRESLPQTIRAFMDLLKQLDELPPLRIGGQEYSARQLRDAEKTFTCLSSQLDSIDQDISCLEYIFNRVMTMLDGLPMSE